MKHGCFCRHIYTNMNRKTVVLIEYVHFLMLRDRKTLVNKQVLLSKLATAKRDFVFSYILAIKIVSTVCYLY